MSDAVETMMYNKVNHVPWHGKGTSVDGLATAEECITASGLDWTVLKQPVFMQRETMIDKKPNLGFHEIEGKYETYRDTDQQHLGVVGSKYTPLQNKDAFKFFDAIVGENKAIYETAGSLMDGRRIWLLAKLPGNMRILGDDITDKYLLLANGHDGYFNLVTQFTGVRVVCSNTLNMAINAQEAMFKLRHTASIADNLEKTGDIIRAQHIYFNEYEECAQAMTKVSTSEKDAEQYFRQVFNRMSVDEVENTAEVDEDALADTKIDPEPKEATFKALDRLKGLREVGKGTELPGVRGTLYGDFQAAVEYLDHYQTRRKTTDRMNSLMFGANTLDRKQKALSVAKDLVLLN